VKMWKDYFKEVKDIITVEKEQGFFTYQVREDSVFVEHFYIVPEFRNKKVGQSFVNELYQIAKQHNKKMLKCLVDLETNNYAHNLMIYLHCGGIIWDAQYPHISMCLFVEEQK